MFKNNNLGIFKYLIPIYTRHKVILHFRYTISKNINLNNFPCHHHTAFFVPPVVRVPELMIRCFRSYI